MRPFMEEVMDVMEKNYDKPEKIKLIPEKTSNFFKITFKNLDFNGKNSPSRAILTPKLRRIRS